MSLRDNLTSLLKSGADDPLTPDESIEITAQLNHKLMPMDRGSRYEDPLHDMLVAERIGEVVGGGTMQLESGELEYIDLHIAINDATRAIPFVIESLERLGAPRGSKLQIHESEQVHEIPFGVTEGVAVYLDGASLPDEVYATSDVNVVIDEINIRISDYGEMHGYWEGPTETALYFYGDDAEAMKTLMSDFLTRYPLCRGARVVTIAPRSD
jgi:hypothetical protein